MPPLDDIPVINAIGRHLRALGRSLTGLLRRFTAKSVSKFHGDGAGRHFITRFNAALITAGQRVKSHLSLGFSGLLSRTTTRDQKSIWWGYLPVALVAIIGASITVAASLQSLFLAEKQAETAFHEASQDRLLVMQRELENALGVVQDIASFFEASEYVDRREFRKFVGPALKRQAGIKALEWVPIVPFGERAAFVEDARRSFPPFNITEVAPNGEVIETRDRPRHLPVLYIQPYQQNKEALGLDLSTNPVFAELLSHTESTDSLHVSPGLSLVDETGARIGIAVAVPVSHINRQPEDPPVEAPVDIRGFAVGIFYVGEVIERALESLRPGGVDIRFFQVQGTGDKDLLFTHLSRLTPGQVPDPETYSEAMKYREQLSVGNQQWEVVFNPVPEKFKSETWHSWIIFTGGIAFTALLTIYVATLVGRARQVRLEVDERTSQLRGAVQALHLEVLERKSAEQELQRLNETLELHIASRTAEAERRAQYLEQFAYVTSHDLKAPLRAVSNLAQWIEEDLDEKLDDASREQLALLRDRVRRMNDLIEGLLEYSRVGRTADSENLVDTRELIDEIVDSLSPPKKFSVRVRGEMPTLYVDRLQLGQVFSNLISNSLKHHGGKKGTIKVTGAEYGDVYQFSVCDDGKGIAPEYHDKVFLMFQTLESSDFENSTGIGLALVKKIVEEHGGTIRLESTPGEGTCFFFTWPKKNSPN